FTMINAGLPLHESLYFLGESADDEGSRSVATELADGISRGRRLSVVMGDFPKAFTPYHLGLVRIGENTGSLALVLKITAEHLEKSRGLTQKIKSALTYPMVLIAGTLLLLTIAPSWLLQGQLEMLKSSKVELPFLTRGLLAWSDFCQSPLFLLLVAGVVGAAVALGRNRSWRKKAIVFSHSVPGLGKIVRTAGAARFARALCISMKAGVSLLEAVTLSAQSTGDPVLEDTMKKVRGRLMEGETLAECFGGAMVLPDGFAQVMAAGEQSGKVVSLLELMADLYDMEVEAAISSLTVMLEPMLLLFIGIFTAIVLMATLQPTILVLQAL
ncbi:MAG: type II secretion system F family protein, partial [Candidatus Eremiobacteraeota bacterium]|nr:type II secretion system F family protein [Candidatus Eremiobacteraeota bacterium]